MGYPDKDGVLAFLRNGDKNSMAITFFGTLNTLNTIQRVPSRIPISVSSHREKEKKRLDHHVRDKERSPSRHDRDVRYLNSFKIWKNRSPPCNQHMCPTLMGRYEKHKLEKHTVTIKKQGTQCGGSCTKALNTNSVTTSTTSDTVIKNIFDDCSHSSMLVLPDININKSYIMNKKQWYQNLPDDKHNSQIYDDNDVNDARTNIDNHNFNDDGFQNLSKLKTSGNDFNNRSKRKAIGLDYDSDEHNSKHTSDYNTNNNNKDYSYNSNTSKHSRNEMSHDSNAQNPMYSDAAFNNSRHNINNDKIDYNNNAKRNGGSSNSRHQYVIHDTNEQNTMPDDASNNANNNMDYDNSAKFNAGSNYKHNSNFSNRHHSEFDDEGTRKQFNDNNVHSMKYNAEYSGSNDKGNLNDILSTGTNLSKKSNNYSNDAGPSKEINSFGHNPNSNHASFDDGHIYKYNKSLNKDEHKLNNNTDCFHSYKENTDDISSNAFNVNRIFNHNHQNEDNLSPDAYPFNCGKQYRPNDAVNDDMYINGSCNANDNTETCPRINNKCVSDNFDNRNYARPCFSNRSNNKKDCSRRPVRDSNNAGNSSIVPLKRTDTREIVTPTRNIYKHYVQTEIRDWLEDVPLYLNHSEQESYKSDIINTLTRKIIGLDDECYCDTYEEKFKFTVDQMLCSLPMWYPGQKSDQILFRNNIIDKLYNKIKALNQNTRTAHITTSCSYNCKNNEIRNRLSLTDAAEEELKNWVAEKSNILPISYDDATVTEVLLKRLVPMLRNPVNPSTSKFNLKCAIAEVLNELIGPHCSSSINDIQLYKLAEDLAIGLLAIQAQYEQDNRMATTASQAQSAAHCSRQTNSPTTNINESMIHRNINKCLCATQFVFQDDIKIILANIIANYMDPNLDISEIEVKNELLRELHRYCIPEGCARHIAEDIIDEIKIALNQSNSFQTMCIPSITSKIGSAYASEEMSRMTFPATSTPKKKKPSKLNPEEIEYEEKVTTLIRNWMETLPEFIIEDDEAIFKEAMINDLAGEITDQAKLEQIAKIDDADNFRKYIVYRWVNKMNVFDIDEIKGQIDDFLCKLKQIDVPILTKPQGGNRQAMTQLRENYENFQELHLPKATDILEDEISIWMHEQPVIFDTDKDTRGQKIHEIVDVLHDKFSNKRPEEEILIDLALWLDGILKPEDKKNIGWFAADLKKRVINLPQDSTLAANLAKKEKERAEFFEEKDKKKKCCTPVEFTTTDKDTINVDKTMRQFISKYIEHNYDVDDPLARGAFSHLLKAKLQRLNTPASKEVYDKPEKAGTNSLLPRGKLIRELDYIKDVSDWLKNIAVAPSFNTTGNRNRIDFVNDLAHNIFDIEEERDANPDAMDYNLYLASVIGQFIDHIPIEKEHHNSQYMNFIMKQLITKIIAHRNTNYNAFNTDESIDTSGVNNDNIGEFIEEFILVNGSDIADDELKLEAWSVRLLNEIKKMVHADPNTPTKGEVYNKLLDVPKPGDETMKQFETEIEYIKEISQWIKNLPLLPVSKSEREERIKMINELTEKVTERENLKLNDPNDTKAESEFAEYIAKWIGELSLDESREVVVAVVIQQLLNRIEKVKSRFDSSIQPPESSTDSAQPIDGDSQLIKSPQLIDNQLPLKRNKQPIQIDDTKMSHPTTCPASEMVDAIEKWSTSLPIKGNDKEVNSLKNDVSKKLYQTVGELNIDPRTFNDDLLYKNMLVDEVDAVLEKLPQNPELESNKDQLRDVLVQNIVEAQQAIKENSAGEMYKHRLEHAIEASMPHSIKGKQVFDPGFEIYKSHLADMFILENFDHANDAVKVQYEKAIKKEIDKYCQSVKNKSVVPLSNDEIYNELYSALFKVPVPNEKSVISEVEEIKTRCVIDMWYDKLPLKRTNNVSDLLERDKILATLAKRVHEIENSTKSDDKMHTEIKKWLGKLPLLAGQEKNIESFAINLENELKSSANDRKCMTTDPVKGKESKKTKPKGKSLDLSCIKSKPKKKTVDSLMAMVENWCLSLPIYSNRPQDAENDDILKDNLVTTIMIKLCELNMDPKIFNDNLLYDSLLDEELDNVLKDIPTSCNFEKIKAEKKQQLKDAVKSIKPLFKEEKAKHQYNQSLDNTVAKVLVTSENLEKSKEADFKNIKNDIVENFVQYTYDKGDDESRQEHKIKIHDAVVKFLSENISEGKDPLMLRNKLICELKKVPEPGHDTMKEDVEEIRMKTDITKFFNEQSIDSNDDKTNQVKSSLAVKLNELELEGHTPNNEAKMKQEITKHLKNLQAEVNPQAIDKFVNELKGDEADRRAPAKLNTDSCPIGCMPGHFCTTYISPVELQPPKNVPDEPCLDHVRNKKDNMHKNKKKQKEANVICECESDHCISSPTVDCECVQNSMYSPTNYVECHCKICDCAREIQKLAQGRQFMNFRPRNKEKINFCMPAGYFYF